MARERPAPIQLVTSNALNADQKAQLLRSTQKLTDVLGVAPYFLDVPAPSSSSGSGTSRTTTTSSSNTNSRSRSPNTTPSDQATATGYFRLGLAPPLSPCTPNTPTTPVPSASTSDLGTPLTPTFDHKIYQRRQKVAKLSQMFGENVPPSLVFPAPAVIHRVRGQAVSHTHTGGRSNGSSRSNSPNSAPPSSKSKSQARSEFTSTSTSSPALRGTASLANLRSGGDSSDVAPPKKLKRTPSRSLGPSKGQGHQTSKSVASHPLPTVAPLPSPFVRRAGTVRERTMSERRVPGNSDAIVPSDEGMWNNRDMNKVRQDLRKLRVR